MYDIAVVGGGVAGLVATYRLLNFGYNVVCLEADTSPGGCVRTDRVDGFLCERGAQNVLEEHGGAVCKLARDLGIADEIQAAREQGNFLAWRDRLYRMPSQLLRVLSVRGALRAGRGFVLPMTSGEGEESVGAWTRRRMGEEFAARIADPMISGIYAGDPDLLSMEATFPALSQLERRHRSLLMGSFETKPAKRTVFSFRNGMGTLTSALARSIGPALRTGFRAATITPGKSGGYRIDGAGDPVEANSLVLATSSAAAATLLAGLDADGAKLLQSIRFAPVVSASLTLAPSDLTGQPPKGYGLVRPYCEGTRLLGCLFTSSCFAGFSPKDKILIRILFGGQRDPEAAGLADGELLDLARRELRPLIGIKREAHLQLVHVVRHRLGLPQYEIGHSERVRSIEGRLRRLRIHVTGNSYRGLSVSRVVEEVEKLSSNLLQLRAAA